MINNIYIKPKVKLLNSTPLAIAEIAARTAYQSFEKSENDIVKNYNFNLKLTDDIDNSKLLENLSWVTFHHSVLEHIVFQFHIKDIGRGVLQEFSRHRIASLTVKSTRYTLGPIILYFIVSQVTKKRFLGFKNFLSIDNNMSVLKNKKMLNDEIYSMYEKLETIYIDDPEIFIENSLSKNQKKVLEEYSNESPTELYKLLINERMKRNVGDNFKFKKLH
jgi:thymidylate synthase ThyX